MEQGTLEVGTHNRDAVILAWWGAAKRLAEVKQAESQLRKEVFEMCFPTPKIGVNKEPLGSGYVLKADVKQTYTINKNEAVEPPDYSNVAEVLAQLPPAVASSLIRWKPELSISAYKQLTQEEQAIVNKILTIKDSTPSLEMIEPKNA